MHTRQWGMLLGTLAIVLCTGLFLFHHVIIMPQFRTLEPDAAAAMGATVLVLGLALAAVLVLVIILLRRNADLDKALREQREQDQRAEREAAFSRAIVDHAGDGICVCHSCPEAPLVRFTVWNERMTDITGYTMAEINRLGWYQTVYPDMETQDRARRRMADMREGRNMAAEEWVIRRADGSERILSISTSVLHQDTSGSHVLAIMQDITERIRSHRELQAYERWMQAFIEAIPHPLFAKDRDGRYTLVNPAFERFLGIRADRVLGRTTAECWTADDAAIYAAKDRELMSSGGTQEYEHRLRDGAGTMRDVFFSKACVRGPNGEAVGLVGTCVDVTELKQTQAGLRDSQERLALALKGADLGTWDWDIVTGRVIFDERWASMLGYRVQDIEPSADAWKERIHPDDVRRVMNALEKHLAGDTPSYETEHRLRHRKGHWVWVLDKGTVIARDADGTPLRACGTHLDITERWTMKERLLQSQKLEAIGQLAGGIAHDFNNTLGGILGAAEIVIEDVGGNHSARRYLDTIIQAAETASDLTARLLTFSRRREKTTAAVDMHRTIRAAAELLRRSIDRRVTITLDLTAPDPTVRGDAGQLQNAVLNLGLNARDAMPQGGCLHIATRTILMRPDSADVQSLQLAPGRYLHITVSDDGTGMDADVLRRAFEPFFTTKRPGEGTGLGLAAVYGTVTDHDGGIYAESSPGRGSTFHLYLPLAHTAEPAAEDNGQTSMSGSGTVLLVDDEDVIRTTGARLLQHLGYDVITAADGAEGVALFKTHRDRIDLVLLDIVMPEMDGHECFHAILELDPNARVVFCSGYATDDTVTKLLDAGAAGFLSKPYRIADLSRAVGDVLTGATVRRD